MKVKFKDHFHWLILFVLAWGIANAVSAQSYPYKLRYLTVDEGLSHTDANDIAQDRQGYIWVATYFGISRYDGYSVKRFYNTNTPSANAFKNRIRCLYPDENGDIWLGTEGGLQSFNSRSEQYIDFSEPGKPNRTFEKLYKPSGDLLYGLSDRRFLIYKISRNALQEVPLLTPVGVEFTDMAADQDGVLYLSSTKGLWILDETRQFRKVYIAGVRDQNLSLITFGNSRTLLTASCNEVFSLVRQDESNDLRICLNFATDSNFRFTSDECIKSVIVDAKGYHWIATRTDVLKLDSKGNIVQVINSTSSLRGLNSKSVTKIIIDRSECLWACTFGGGVNYFDLNEKPFYTLQHNPGVRNSLSGNHIRSVLEDRNELWVGTTANGLSRYNLKFDTCTYYNTTTSPVKLKNDVISALTFDDSHQLWIGSANGIQILNPVTNAFYLPRGYEKFPTYNIETLVTDFFGNIWFGNHMDRFGVIWKDQYNYYHVKYYDEGYFIFAEKKKPQLFVSSTHGLKQINIDKEGNIVKSFRYNASSSHGSLSSDYTYPVSKGNDSTYWIGTIGGGLNRLTINAEDNSYSIKSYDGKYGVFNDVESLEVDDKGNVWMGGDGLEYFNAKTEKLIRYDKNDGLQGNSFKVGSSFKGGNGMLYFGGINGLNYFNPDQITFNRIEARPVLTDITINSKKAGSGEASSGEIIPLAIGYLKKLSLSYLQNNFVISFSSMHFANPLKCKYRYQLVGFDKEWRYTDGKNPNAYYSNLDYNNYKLLVEATNNDGIWSTHRAELAIIVTPPWWKSTLAKAIYFLLIISALSGIYIYQGRWYRLKRELAVRSVNERKKEEMLKQRDELYQQQLNFFTNVSHEFRTPLTLIVGPLESLISQNKNSGFDYSYQLMYKNIKRLTNLVSELMNFTKVADSVIKLYVEPLNVNTFCKDLAGEFQSLAVSRQIDFTFTDRTEQEGHPPVTGLFDVKVIEKILFNLLNNSLKYTNAGGKISFDIFFDLQNVNPPVRAGFEVLNEKIRAEQYLYFRITDSGIGVSSESVRKIFDRYYRVSNNHLGSGVGLALVKSLTQLHKGDIYVFSERHIGTDITIGIPWGHENYNEFEKEKSATNGSAQLEDLDNTVLTPLPDYDDNPAESGASIRKHILIVEDNEELRAFLRRALQQYYDIAEAEDGNSGIISALETIPDLIISDVMMPGMNGIEFCRIMKERFETSHIPFIILSAKDALAAKIEGLQSGADFYFAKPLNTDLLLLTIQNIFEQSRKLKLRYTNNYLADATELVHSETDKIFVKKLVDLIEENMEDPELDVDFLCEHLFISRTKLYQKIKSISAQSVAEFIRTIRLKKAIEIMTHEDIAMNEVANRIGLQNGSAFSRAFKKEYGKSPMQFIQSLKNE